MSFVLPESKEEKALRQLLLPVIPVLPDTITMEEFREAAGISMAVVRVAVGVGLRSGVILRKIGKIGRSLPPPG